MSTNEPEPYAPFPLAELTGASQPTPVCWRTLDRNTAAREWPALAEWVRWLVARYAITPRVVPPCWYRHGSLLEELSALRTGWLAAYAPDSPGSAPLEWHTMFANTRARLEEAVSRSGCTKDSHTGDKTPPWLSAKDHALDEAITSDLARREGIPPVAPWLND